MAEGGHPGGRCSICTRFAPGICVSNSCSGFSGRLHFHPNPLPALQLRRQVLRRVHGDDFALIDDHNAIARHADFGQNVRGKNDRVIARKTFDQMADFDDLFRIEADGGLVENNHIGIVYQRLRQADALLIAAGKTLDELRALVFDVGLAIASVTRSARAFPQGRS